MAASIGLTATSGKTQGVPFIFTTNVPLDNRVVVYNRVSLVTIDTWTKYDFIYPGLICCVLSTQEIYVFKGYNDSTRKRDFYSKTDILDKETQDLKSTYADNSDTVVSKVNTYWTKIPSQTDLETNKKDLFSFQGVASAIDADHCTLTIGPASRGTTTSGYSFSVSDYKVDIEGDTYFYWSSTAKGAPTGVWTRGDFANGTKTYTKSQFTANIFVYGGETYYETGETAIVQNVERTKYLTLDGDILWVDTDNYIYETSASTTKVQTDAVTLDRDSEVVFFTEDKTTLSDVLNSGKAEKATNGNGSDIKSNKGHVYQLGEEEYASNGTIWVQLGSPKEDWIVIK